QQPSTTLSPAALKEIAEVEAEIDRIEAQTLERLTELPNNQVDQIELLGKLMLYDKELSVNRNQACAFCHMPETGVTGRCRSASAPPAPITAPCEPASAIASRRRTPTRRFRPFSITIPVRVIWSAAISGTCVQPAAGWAIQRPSRRRGRRLILSKWGCPILLVWFTEHRSGHIARCSKVSGVDRPSSLHGGLTGSRPAINGARWLPTTRSRSILRSLIAAAPRPPSIRWRSPSPATRRRRR